MTLSTRSKTVIGVIALILFSMIALYAANYFTSDDTIDPRSSAATGDQGGVAYGTLVNPKLLLNSSSDPKADFFYQQAVRSNFSWVTTQTVKFWSIHKDGADVYDWEDTDDIANWASSNSKKLTLHALLWDDPDQLPDALPWYYDLPDSTARIQALENHVFAVMNRYKNDADAVHVINHPIRHNGNGDYMGTGLTVEDITVRMFNQVNTIDTEIKYLVNAQTKTLTSTDARDAYVAYINTVNSQLDEGSKIDAIGVMAHLGNCNDPVPDIATMKENIDYIYTQTGVPIWITELDISYDGAGSNCSDDLLDPRAQYDPGNGSPFSTWFDYQKDRYQMVMPMLKNNPGVENITFWGFYDGKIWRKHAGLFFGPEDEEGDFTVKPSFDPYLKALLCTPSCDNYTCGFDGCGGSCGSCAEDKICDNGQCADKPPEIPPPVCKSISADKTEVETKDEKINITVNAEAGDGNAPLEIVLLAASGKQTNNKPEDFVCVGTDPDDPEYSYYCNDMFFTLSWAIAGKVTNSNELAVETTFTELAEGIDSYTGNEGREYEGTLEENGIILTVNVAGNSTDDVCSGLIARNNGDGVYNNNEAWDQECVNSCNLEILYTGEDSPNECRRDCDDDNPCASGYVCEAGICRNDKCPKTDDEDCTCPAGPQDRDADVNEDGKVDILDISQVLSVWGDTIDATAREDVNDDLTIDILDISVILGDWD